MAPTGKEAGDRRKSSSFFSRPTLSGLAQINTNVAHDGKKEAKKSKRTSMFGSTGNNTHLTQEYALSPTGSEHSPKLRPRTLQKGRPSSIFGSMGKKNAFSFAEDGEGSDGLVGSTTPESPAEENATLIVAAGKSVLHHGEVQTTSGMFRKKKEYLVLTDTHLIRFKSQSRASDAFPSIPPVYGRSTTRHPSTTSIGSIHEVQSTNSHASNENENKIPLKQVVTAYKLEDGRPFFTTEVVWLDEEYTGVGSIQLMLHDPKEADLWHTSIRAAAQKARLMMEEQPYPERIIAYLVRALESVADYDAEHFQVFRVVRRNSKPGKSSSDDLQKLGSSVFYMVIGINRVHLIPLPDFTEPTTRHLSSKVTRNVFGIVTLVSVTVNYTDDRFELSFRTPMQAVVQLDMAASATPDIATVLVRALLYLKPQWLDYNFQFNGPRRLLESVEAPMMLFEEDLGGFDRTLVAYCMAYNVNPTNIRYTVDMEAEDAPEFKLFNAANGGSYSRLELLAIFRSLRYNEAFHSISFRGIDLGPLHSQFDTLGGDHIAWTGRSGLSITKYFNINPQGKSLLQQEVQALALKSNRLRRLDFGYALPKRRPKDTFDIEGNSLEKDPGTEIVAGLLPICRAQLTKVNWIVLSGIELGETDFDDIIPALDEVQAKIRAIECGNCHLQDRGIMQLLGHMERQNATLECINIADNPGKVHVERFQVALSRFPRIRRLDLSRITKTFGDEPLFKPEVMLSWKLEELNMNGVPTNELTLDSISTYLASPMSDSLRVINMDQCNLSGMHIALLMRSMCRRPGQARELHLSVSANRLDKGIRDIIQAIKDNMTPAYLSIRMIEFVKEDHCKQLLQAVKGNTTLRQLDISKASLPYDASDETCDALRDLFAENTTLEEFDISGEQAHLEVARFGIGLSQALNGLKHNKTLKVLRIEYQNLGLEGANTLSSVLEHNTALTHIYCEHNDINLQGFTTLVNALANNLSIVDIPFMQDDQGESLRKMREGMQKPGQLANPSSNHHHHPTAHFDGHGHGHGHLNTKVRKTLTNIGAGVGVSVGMGGGNSGSGGNSKGGKEVISAQDMDEFVKVMVSKWRVQNDRMAAFLNRNRNRLYAPANCSMEEEGEDGDVDGVYIGGGNGSFRDGVPEEYLRPVSMSGVSDHGVLEMVLSNSTPKGEVGNPVDELPGSTSVVKSKGKSHGGGISEGVENMNVSGGGSAGVGGGRSRASSRGGGGGGVRSRASSRGEPPSRNELGGGRARGKSDVSTTPSKKDKDKGKGKSTMMNLELPVIRRGEKMFDLDAEMWDSHSDNDWESKGRERMDASGRRMY